MCLIKVLNAQKQKSVHWGTPSKQKHFSLPHIMSYFPDRKLPSAKTDGVVDFLIHVYKWCMLNMVNIRLNMLDLTFFIAPFHVGRKIEKHSLSSASEYLC